MLLRRFNAMLAVTAIMPVVVGCRTPETLSRSSVGPASRQSRRTTPIESDLPEVKLAGYRNTSADTSGVVTPDTATAAHSVDQPRSTSVPLTLEEAIALGLQRNPDLAAVRAGEPVARAAMRVAETYPYNPQFQTQVLPYARSRSGLDDAVSQQHVIVQTFELGGQQQHREGAASATWGQVQSTIRQAELMNEAQTSRLFFTAVYQRELRDLNRMLADLNEQLTGVTERREKAGQANHADVALARLQAQASRRQQRLVEASYQTALLALQTQLNVDQNTPVELVSPWENMRWKSLDEAVGMRLTPRFADEFGTDLELPLDSWDEMTLRSLVAERPDVLAARAAVSAALANLQLADAMRCPSLQAGPMYQRDNSSTEFWGVQAQIDIPVVDTGRPLVQQRSAELRLQRITAEQLEERAVLEARAAILRYERARRLVDESLGDMTSEFSAALQPFEEQFQAGQITLLQVFGARATLAQSRQSYLDLMNEVSQAAADVTQTIGVSPQRLLTPVVEQSETPPIDERPSATTPAAFLRLLPQP